MMIKDPITITIPNSYDWSKWEKTLIEKCIIDNPKSNLEEVAELLNLSARTVYRKIEDYKINVAANRKIGNEICSKLNIVKKKTNVA